jgi:hypothetical protein
MTSFPPTIRPAIWSDQPTIASICSLAFENDNLFATTMHPHLKQYPADFTLYWLREAQLNWFNPRHHFVVSTVLDSTRPGSQSRVVVGVAQWIRMGDGVTRRWNPLLPIMNGLMKTWVRISSWIWPNRAADPSKMSLFKEAWPFIWHFWSGERERCWDLAVLAVHPAYRGQGVGRGLVKWGLDRAEEEGVAASVKMAPGKEEFYGLCGFEPVVVGNCGQGEGNPMKEVEGGNIFFRDPKR